MDVEYFLKISVRLEIYALVCLALLCLVCYYKYREVRAIVKISPAGKLYGDGKLIRPEETSLTVMMGTKLADFIYMLKAGVFASAMLSVLSFLMSMIAEMARKSDDNVHGLVFLASIYLLLMFIVSFVVARARTNRLSPEFFDRHLMRELALAAEEKARSEEAPEETGVGSSGERIRIIHSETEISRKKFLSTLLYGGIFAAMLAAAVSLLIVAVLMIVRL